jgi:hypothetical protein
MTLKTGNCWQHLVVVGIIAVSITIIVITGYLCVSLICVILSLLLERAESQTESSFWLIFSRDELLLAVLALITARYQPSLAAFAFAGSLSLQSLNSSSLESTL